MNSFNLNKQSQNNIKNILNWRHSWEIINYLFFFKFLCIPCQISTLVRSHLREEKGKVRVIVGDYGLRRRLTLLSLLIRLIRGTYCSRKLSARASLILTVTKTSFGWLRLTLIRCWRRIRQINCSADEGNNDSSFHVKGSLSLSLVFFILQTILTIIKVQRKYKN